MAIMKLIIVKGMDKIIKKKKNTEILSNFNKLKRYVNIIEKIHTKLNEKLNLDILLYFSI